MMIHHWTLQQIRLFESVARNRSYTRAAEELHLTQPAVSMQIKRLAESVDLPLIEVVGKRLYLTRAGEEFYEASRDVLHRLNGLAGTMAALKGDVSGPLVVAAVTSATFFMPHFLGRFLRSHESVRPKLTVTNRTRVLERLAKDNDDFVVIGQVPDERDFAVFPFMDHSLVAVAHPDHPLIGDPSVSLARLAEQRFLMREAGSGTRRAVEHLFARYGLTVEPYMELGSSEAIKQAIMAGLGVSVLSLVSLGLELEAGRVAVVKVTGLPLQRTWYGVYRSGKVLTPTAQAFLDFLAREGRAWATAAASRS